MPERYRSRSDGGLDCLDESAKPTPGIEPGGHLAILYRCDPLTGRASAIELHGPESEVVATWRKMWKPLALGTLAGGPDINASLRLVSYPAHNLDANALAALNAALSNDLEPDTLQDALDRHAVKGIDHEHHDPHGSPATR